MVRCLTESTLPLSAQVSRLGGKDFTAEPSCQPYTVRANNSASTFQRGLQVFPESVKFFSLIAVLTSVVMIKECTDP